MSKVPESIKIWRTGQEEKLRNFKNLKQNNNKIFLWFGLKQRVKSLQYFSSDCNDQTPYQIFFAEQQVCEFFFQHSVSQDKETEPCEFIGLNFQC